ncbi:MAG: hypothetical protein KF911_09295 [Pseudomonadales bacterium]|nr:hypothetical protein [Pseudomonadales bacterium]
MLLRDFLFVGAVLLATTGCATVTKGTSGVTQVQVNNCAERIACEGTNKKGSWAFTAPGPLKYKKSDEDMVIACEDGPESLSVSMAPTRGGMIWGNVLVGGVVGGGVDASTDAHWEYPETITLQRRYCNGVAVEPTPQGAAGVADAAAESAGEGTGSSEQAN